MSIESAFFANLSPHDVTAKLKGFKRSYRADWTSWLNAVRSGIESPYVATRFEEILRRWNPCRSRGGVRNGFSDTLKRANPHLERLVSVDLRSLAHPALEDHCAIQNLWSIFEESICCRTRSSEVGISKAIMLLTCGRVGPAFDSYVRKSFCPNRRITTPTHLLEAYAAVADDLMSFEVRHGPIEGCLPEDWTAPGVGRIVDMIAGPRE